MFTAKVKAQDQQLIFHQIIYNAISGGLIQSLNLNKVSWPLSLLSKTRLAKKATKGSGKEAKQSIQKFTFITSMLA